MSMMLQLLIGPTTAARSMALLSTYFIQVALWVAAVLLVTRVRALSPRARCLTWMMALVGPLLTTLCPAVIASTPRVSYVLPVLAVPRGDVAGESSAQLWSALVCVWLCAAVLGASRFAGSFALLWRGLRQRSAVTDARLLARLSAVRERTGLVQVRLSESARVTGPLVLGSAEICIPFGKLAALSDSELDSVFAHELAHLERGDGLWFPLLGLLQSLLWTHPLNHLVAARIRESAELACDDRAVELTGDALGLARALSAVAAGSMLRASTAVPNMARSASSLVQRVARLVKHGAAGARPVRAGRRSKIAAFAMLAASGVAAASLDVRAAVAPSYSQAASENLDRELDALQQQEQALDAEWRDALNVPGAAQAGTQASVNVLELQQALRHVHEAQAWTEERLVAQSTKAYSDTVR